MRTRRKARVILQVLSDHEGPLVADFARVYGTRLIAAVEELPYQEIIDLIQWIPPGSAYRASVEAKGDTAKALQLFGWGAHEELLLSLQNTLMDNNWITAQANSKKTIPRPKPIPGPRGSTRSRSRTTDVIAMAGSLLKEQE